MEETNQRQLALFVLALRMYDRGHSFFFFFLAFFVIICHFRLVAKLQEGGSCLIRARGQRIDIQGDTDYNVQCNQCKTLPKHA